MLFERRLFLQVVDAVPVDNDLLRLGRVALVGLSMELVDRINLLFVKLAGVSDFSVTVPRRNF